MKRDKKLHDFIEGYFRENPNAPTEELIDFVTLYAEKPDVKKLVRQYYTKKTNQFAAKVRGKDGKRRIYADKRNKLYTDIDQETSIEVLTNVRQQMIAQIRGDRSAFKKVAKRLAEISGQTELLFEDIGTEIKAV